jgi:hypothetical protein
MQRLYPPDLVATSRLPRGLIVLFPLFRLVRWVSSRVVRHSDRQISL